MSSCPRVGRRSRHVCATSQPTRFDDLSFLYCRLLKVLERLAQDLPEGVIVGARATITSSILNTKTKLTSEFVEASEERARTRSIPVCTGAVFIRAAERAYEKLRKRTVASGRAASKWPCDQRRAPARLCRPITVRGDGQGSKKLLSVTRDQIQICVIDDTTSLSTNKLCRP
jgi:hypothetical protein